jgi:hypothetical protein
MSTAKGCIQSGIRSQQGVMRSEIAYYTLIKRLLLLVILASLNHHVL